MTRCLCGSGELREYLEAQFNAIDEFKWNMGIELQHDPLNDYSMNEIALRWIELYAAQFRESWYNSGVINGNGLSS